MEAGEVKPWQQEEGKCQDTTIGCHMNVPFVPVKHKTYNDSYINDYKWITLIFYMFSVVCVYSYFLTGGGLGI